MTTYPGPPTGQLRGRELTIERRFRASIEDVWASLTEPERVARWYGTIKGEPLPGHTVMVTLSAEDGAPAEPMLIVECDPPTSFVVETAGMGDPWSLRIALAETGGTTTMTFTHRLADELDATDIGPGWEFYADRHHAAINGNAMPDWTADRYEEILGAHYSAQA